MSGLRFFVIAMFLLLVALAFDERLDRIEHQLGLDAQPTEQP